MSCPHTPDRRSRTRTLRRAVVALSVALILAALALIFGMLVTGHDPALGAKKTSANQGSSSSSGTCSSSSDSAGSATPPLSTRQS
jgi:hypothetical protein